MRTWERTRGRRERVGNNPNARPMTTSCLSLPPTRTTFSQTASSESLCRHLVSDYSPRASVAAAAVSASLFSLSSLHLIISSAVFPFGGLHCNPPAVMVSLCLPFCRRICRYGLISRYARRNYILAGFFSFGCAIGMIGDDHFGGVFS